MNLVFGAGTPPCRNTGARAPRLVWSSPELVDTRGVVCERESMNESTRSPPRRFDEEFKRSALDQLRTSGKTQKAVAAELGISEWNLRDWREALAAKAPTAPSAARPQTPIEMEAEIQRLRRENQSLRNQRDILKKSLGILSEPLVNGSRI